MPGLVYSKLTSRDSGDVINGKVPEEETTSLLKPRLRTTKIKYAHNNSQYDEYATTKDRESVVPTQLKSISKACISGKLNDTTVLKSKGKQQPKALNSKACIGGKLNDTTVPKSEGKQQPKALNSQSCSEDGTQVTTIEANFTIVPEIHNMATISNKAVPPKSQNLATKKALSVVVEKLRGAAKAYIRGNLKTSIVPKPDQNKKQQKQPLGSIDKIKKSNSNATSKLPDTSISNQTILPKPENTITKDDLTIVSTKRKGVAKVFLRRNLRDAIHAKYKLIVQKPKRSDASSLDVIVIPEPQDTVTNEALSGVPVQRKGVAKSYIRGKASIVAPKLEQETKKRKRKCGSPDTAKPQDSASVLDPTNEELKRPKKRRLAKNRFVLG